MTQFAIGRYAANDYRLVRYDGSTSQEIGGGWNEHPTSAHLLLALNNHYGSDFLQTNQSVSDVGYILDETIPTVDKEANHTWPWG